MKRILIIGINGAGKSTFANKLGKKLNRQVIHLDSVYYKSGWQEAHLTRDEWKQKVRDLVVKERWIIDGHYNSTLNIRVPVADTIIFFNFNKFLCLYRICKRAMDKTQPFDKPEGNLNKLSWNLVKKLIIFPKKKILNMLEQYKNTKKIYIVKNDTEVQDLLARL